MPESKVPEGTLGDPLVIVCGIALPSLFLHITVVPARTVIETGSGAGACNLSTVPTCIATITKDTSIQANFK